LTSLHLPWLELAIVLPLVGALWVRWLNGPDLARRHSLIASGLTLLCALAGWGDFRFSQCVEAHDRWDVMMRLSGEPVFTIDTLNAPLLSLASLLYFLTLLATLRTHVPRFSFTSALASQAILLATLSCKQPWIIIGLLTAGTMPLLFELRAGGKPTRIFLSHMSLFVALLVAGQALIEWDGAAGHYSVAAAALLMGAVLLRSGIVPMHCWLTDLFEHATFGSALLFVTPMVGAYAAMRLVLPIAPEGVLHAAALVSLVTAIYAAAMALVQREARRFFCFIFLSHSSLVFVGMETATAIGLTGALCVWISVALSMTGFGLALRSIEARTGRLSLDEFHGLYAHTPRLAGLFLLMGLASIGFPGTAGFVGAELLVEGAVQVNPLVGIAIVIAAALNGLAVLRVYFRVFTGTRHKASINLRSRLLERMAVLLLTALILGGGLYPQPGVTSRYEGAQQLIKQRQQRLGLAADSGASHSGQTGWLRVFAPSWR
jgi:NADH-quinone oxidoreductase subunit M